jgi:putative ABC transport system ATP-binding protein
VSTQTITSNTLKTNIAETDARNLVVDIKDISYSFGLDEERKQVLYNINLNLYYGEVIILTGPSGAGKTTLLTLIGALRGLQEGSLKVFGKELAGLCSPEQEEIRKNIGFIFQANNLLESLTAYQNVKLVTELKDYPQKEADRRTVDILTRLGLQERLFYKPHKLSGGQQQRVAIARALVNHPRLILADEPTAELDQNTGRQVINILQNLAKKEGCTILIVTHNDRIMDLADRIVTMVDGRLISNVLVNKPLTTV